MHNTYKGPFPFKGKGAEEWRNKTLQRRVEHLHAERQAVMKTMQCLIDDFNQTFAGKLPAYLALQQTVNGKYLRWRMRGARQRYFAITTDDTGRQFLSAQTPTVQHTLLEFEQQRLRLNLTHGLYNHEYRFLQRLIEQTKQLRQLAQAVQ